MTEHVATRATALLQWGSETGSRRRERSARRAAPGFKLQWGSETGSRRRAVAGIVVVSHDSPRFNGAPRLGLGEGCGVYTSRAADLLASMGLRDWVSEKGMIRNA